MKELSIKTKKNNSVDSFNYPKTPLAKDILKNNLQTNLF